jgi:ribonuclease BN (tRNA processing enzyme)
MSSAVVVGTDVYIVDFGRGWSDSFFAAGLSRPGKGFGGLESLRAAFVTHLHSDHLVDYPRLLLFGATDGLPRRTPPLEIFGPGRVTDIARIFAGIKDPAKRINPLRPAPGIVDLTASLLSAFATDLNDNMSDGGMPHPSTYLKIHDIEIPAQAGASLSNPSPKMAPFEIYKDEHVTVSAILVNHAPMFPAFAFRFDTPKGSIVFSGDTNRNENVITLAKGADILVHETINMEWARSVFPVPRTPAQEAKLRHLLEAHTDVRDLGPLAAEAGVKLLVLSHLAPPTLSDADWLSQIHGFKGKTAIGKPLASFELPVH